MLNFRLAGGHRYGKQLFTWLSLVMSLTASFVLSFFPLDVLDQIWDLFFHAFLIYTYVFTYLHYNNYVKYTLAIVDFHYSLTYKTKFRLIFRLPSIQLPALLFVCVLFVLFVDVLSGEPKQN